MGGCEFVEDLNCDDGDPCTIDSCDPATGCVNTPIDCSDGIDCTIDECVRGECVNTPDDAFCDDGNVCTDDICSVVDGGCINPLVRGAECAVDADCLDTEECADCLCVPSTGPGDDDDDDDDDGIDDLCDLGKPCAMTFCYNGESCEASDFTMDPNKVECEGDPMFTDPVFIIANDKDDPNKGKVWFTGYVDLNGCFTIEAANAGKDKLKSKTYFHIFGTRNDETLQFLLVHTSCSQPLVLGDQFGSLVLDSYVPKGECEEDGDLPDGDDDDG